MRPDDRWSVEDGQYVPMQHLFRLHQQALAPSQPQKLDSKRKRASHLNSGSADAASLLAELADVESKMGLYDVNQRCLHVPDGKILLGWFETYAPAFGTDHPPLKTGDMVFEQAAMRWWHATVLRHFGSTIRLMWCVYLGGALPLLCRYVACMI